MQLKSTVCPTRWFSFYEAVNGFFTCRLRGKMQERGDELLIKTKFLNVSASLILTAMKYMHSESTGVSCAPGFYQPPKAVFPEVNVPLEITDEATRSDQKCHSFVYRKLLEKWYCGMEREPYMTDMHFSDDPHYFWFVAHILNQNLKSGLSEDFSVYCSLLCMVTTEELTMETIKGSLWSMCFIKHRVKLSSSFS